MKKTKVIKRTNLPGNLYRVLINTAVIVLIMDRLQASLLIWGVVGTICGIVIIANIIGLFYEEPVDILNKSDKNE